MSTKAVSAVLDASIRPAYVKLVATALAFHCNEDTGHAWPSMLRLSRSCSCSERQVKRAISQLRQAGVIKVVRASNGGARRATVVYEFDFSALSDAAREDDTGAPRQMTPAHPVSGPAAESGQAESVTPVSPLKGHRRHPRGDTGVTLGGARASPKRDERKAKPSLSSKRRPAPDSGDTARRRVSSPSSGAERPRPADEPTIWMNDDALLSAKGIELGVGDLAAAIAAGRDRVDFSRDVLTAYAARLREARAQRKAARPASTGGG